MKTSSPAARAIDWPEVHRRLEGLRQLIEQEWTPGEAQTRHILKARAQALARPLETAAAEQQIELIEFMLAQETYAVQSSFVREVHPLTDLTPLPCTPPFVVGIVNVRGEIVSVIDIKKFFDLPQKGLTELNKVIILQSSDMTFGILADLIVGVQTIAMNQIQPPPPTLTGIREAYLLGVAQDRMVVLDAAKLLSDRRIVVHETVST